MSLVQRRSSALEPVHRIHRDLVFRAYKSTPAGARALPEKERVAPRLFVCYLIKRRAHVQCFETVYCALLPERTIHGHSEAIARRQPSRNINRAAVGEFPQARKLAHDSFAGDLIECCEPREGDARDYSCPRHLDEGRDLLPGTRLSTGGPDLDYQVRSDVFSRSLPPRRHIRRGAAVDDPERLRSRAVGKLTTLIVGSIVSEGVPSRSTKLDLSSANDS